MYIAIGCYLVCDVINFEVYLILLIKPFSYMTKESEQTFKYLKNERAFKVKRETFFIIQKGFQLFQTWECAFESTL